MSYLSDKLGYSQFFFIVILFLDDIKDVKFVRRMERMIDNFLNSKYGEKTRFTLDEVERDIRENQLTQYFRNWIRKMHNEYESRTSSERAEALK